MECRGEGDSWTRKELRGAMRLFDFGRDFALAGIAPESNLQRTDSKCLCYQSPYRRHCSVLAPRSSLHGRSRDHDLACRAGARVIHAYCSSGYHKGRPDYAQPEARRPNPRREGHK